LGRRGHARSRVTLDPDGDTTGDYALLRTEDPDVARRFGFEDEEGEEEG
jgi:hypothetical protein